MGTLIFVEDTDTGTKCICPECTEEIIIGLFDLVCPNCKSTLVYPDGGDW